MPVLQETITIKNKQGLHARPAALLVRVTSKFTSKIEFECNETRVNGKSIMGVMMLAAAKGSDLIVYADGDDAEESIQGIRELIERKFDED